MVEDYQENGYVLKRQFFADAELDAVEPILRRFHSAWIEANRDHYDHQAINSAYITHADALSAPDRQLLFKFIAADKLVSIARGIIPSGPAFMNTQLFFNPKNSDQKNYWHRDTQYRPDSVAVQKKMHGLQTVLHFRVPMADEPGIELVPESHQRWDDTQEFETRMAENGRTPSDDLPNGKILGLKRGDLLVFSAGMIHRGLYGGDRFALDIIYSDADPDVLQFVDPKSLPDEAGKLDQLDNTSVFAATRRAIKEADKNPLSSPSGQPVPRA